LRPFNCPAMNLFVPVARAKSRLSRKPIINRCLKLARGKLTVRDVAKRFLCKLQRSPLIAPRSVFCPRTTDHMRARFLRSLLPTTVRFRFRARWLSF
jgi:hypothetical protein